MTKTIAALAALLLSGCVTAPAAIDGVERITIRTAPCFGFCPVFEATVSADGAGSYAGETFVKTRGTRTFTASPAEFAALRDRLAPFRPAGDVAYGYDNCDGPLATDLPGVTVTWHDADGEGTTLAWDMSCRQPGLAENADTIYRAWEELPLEALLGPDEERMNYGPR